MRAAIVAAVALVATVSPASAQKYPLKPVRIVVPYAAGGPLDENARALGQKLASRWSQPVLVDNRGGSGGAVGAELVAKAPPDGYTLLLGNGGPITVYPHLRKKRQYDPERDLEPVTFMLSSPMLLLVHPSTPIKSVRDLVRVAKARPKGLTYASAGVGNFQHLSMELLQSLAGITMVHVPYKGAAPAFVDLLSGQVDLMFANILGALPQVKAGRMRAIAVSSAKPSSAAPGVPPVASEYPDFDMTGWQGIFAPAGTPAPVVDRLAREIAAIVNTPEIRAKLLMLGVAPDGRGSAGFSQFQRSEIDKWGKVIKDAGIQAD